MEDMVTGKSDVQVLIGRCHAAYMSKEYTMCICRVVG